MPTIRSARGDFVDFELLAIKSQLAAKPAPKPVQQRREAIEEREGTKVPNAAVNELLRVAADAAAISKAAPKRK
jgi:hypothetical protein